jgi:hypothetical protein
MGFTILTIAVGTALFISSWMTGLNGYADMLMSSFHRPTNRVEVSIGLLQLATLCLVSYVVSYISLSGVQFIIHAFIP